MDSWIRIKDKLPLIGEKILAFDDSKIFENEGPFFICVYYGTGGWDLVNDTYPNSSNYIGFMPTHWMPLPPTPGMKDE